MKILVVDDSKTIRQVVAECVKTLGHEVLYAENGEDCLAQLASNDVDLILMDVEMPGLNGIEATKAIRALNNIEWFPIVFLTNRDDDESYVSGILAGGDAYLAKPITPLRVQVTVIAMERIYLMRQKLFSAQKELERVNRELEQLSYFDQLTGLANRRQFDMTLEKQFALSRRNRSPFSVIMCDVDFFKRYNDAYGHQQGDVCLQSVANVLRRQLLRATDLPCRYGGEEFVLILPDTNLIGAKLLAERVHLAMAAERIPHRESSAKDWVTLSMGIATQTGQYHTEDELLRAADDALYRAKQLGRDRAEVA